MSEHVFQAPSPEDLAALLTQYDIEFFIAQGGMGAVYKGRQLSLDRDIAIKVLPHEVGKSKEFRESFISEAKSMARLNHPNLLGVFDYGTVEGMPYIVMEYVDGGSLHQAAYNQAVEPFQAVSIVKGICEGLAHAHEHGIVHRDIKPSNILLNLKAEPKVADFGLAHAADSDKPGLVMGTPGYTAPEVFQDPNQAGTLADIYSVGVILHQLLTGIDPAGSMVPPSQPTGRLRLDAIWRKATHATPSQRYSDISSMAADLEKWMVAKQVSPTSPARSPASFSPQVRPLPVATHGGGGMGKLLGIGALVILVVIAFMVLEKRKNGLEEQVDETRSQDSGGLREEIPPVLPVSLPPVAEEPVTKPVSVPIKKIENEESVTVEEEAEEETEIVEESPSVEQTPGDPELRERAIALIGQSRNDRAKELADNVSALHFSLKSLSRDATADVLSLLEVLKGDIVEDRIPLIDGVTGLPIAMERAFDDALAKEDSIDERYLANLTRIRDAYVTRLQDAAEGTDDLDLKQRLIAQARRAADLDAWIALLAPEPERVVRSSSGGAGSFVGKWEIHGSDKIQRWIAHPDGRLEVVGQKWEVTWVVLDDGTLEIRWPDKKPYKLSRDEDGWVGTTSFGAPVTFKPGNW